MIEKKIGMSQDKFVRCSDGFLRHVIREGLDPLQDRAAVGQIFLQCALTISSGGGGVAVSPQSRMVSVRADIASNGISVHF